MRALRALPFLVVSACASVAIPPAETEYYREQLALARAATPVRAEPEAATLRDAAAQLEVRAAAEFERIRRRDETEGLLDLDAPGAAAFVARVTDPVLGDAALTAVPLDLEHVLLAVHARNPDVASSRAAWAAAVRMYEQAAYLEDLLLRYSAFTRLATPPVGAAPMREAAFPFPGLVALRGEMIDREVTMARERTRMSLLTVLVAAAKQYHEAMHHEQELAIRTEQVAVVERVVAATRGRVESGRGPQAELLEMEAELSMARNDREHAIASLARARGQLNTLLARAPGATLVLLQHGDPPDVTPPIEPMLAAAARWSPRVREMRAEAARSAAAIRMAEAMLFAAPSPGALAVREPMDEAESMGEPVPMRSSAAPDAPGLPPRDAPPTGAPRAFGPDVAWVAELRERRVGLERAADEAVRAAQREIVQAHYELDAARRMFAVSAKSTVPLAAQAVEERLRLYETGRGEFAELTAAVQRHLAAAHDVAAARHDYGMAEAMLWMAAGARRRLISDAAEESPR